MNKNLLKKITRLTFLILPLTVSNVFAATEENHFCSVFTDEGKLIHRICNDSGPVAFKAYYPEDLKVKSFSWNCQAEEISNQAGIAKNMDDSGRIKLISTPKKIGYLTMFNQQGSLYYFWVEREEEKIVPCGESNWFTCKNSAAAFWFASSDQSGNNFKAKKIRDLKSYPFKGVYTVPTGKELLLIWEGRDDWNSLSSPDQLNSGRISLSGLSLTIKSEDDKGELGELKDLDEFRLFMSKKSLLTKDEIDLDWTKINDKPVSLDLPKDNFKLESINENSGEVSLSLEITKKDAEEEAAEETNDEAKNSSADNEKEKTCFYEKPGIYRPSLNIEYEDGIKMVCAPVPIVEVSSKIGCQIRVKKTDSKDRYADKLKIYLNDDFEARIDGECLDSFEPKWTVFGADSAKNSDDFSSRNIKLKPMAGSDPSVEAEMENTETGEVLQCKEADIIAREKLRWR